jgi:hypothetical protein
MGAFFTVLVPIPSIVNNILQGLGRFRRIWQHLGQGLDHPVYVSNLPGMASLAHPLEQS